jgi:hypothetical protein
MRWNTRKRSPGTTIARAVPHSSGASRSVTREQGERRRREVEPGIAKGRGRNGFIRDYQRLA